MKRAPGLFNDLNFAIYIYFRPYVIHKCSKCFYVYLNICTMRYFFLRNTNIHCATRKLNWLNEFQQYKTAYVELAFAHPVAFSNYYCYYVSYSICWVYCKLLMIANIQFPPNMLSECYVQVEVYVANSWCV